VVPRSTGQGYGNSHCAVDDHSRLANVEAHRDERVTTRAGVLPRAKQFYARPGISVQSVMTDSAKSFRISLLIRQPLAELPGGQLLNPVNRTLLEEWAYVRPYASNGDRLRLLSPWLHRYNYHRAHIALGCPAPVTRVNNLRGEYT
jgi:hypothetical protein